MKARVTCTALLLCALASGRAQTVCDVRTFGAKGDGTSKDTVAIQKAIDSCSRKKGTVRLAAGRFISGPLLIRSGVTLTVQKDAMLLGSSDRSDYHPATLMRQNTVEPFLHISNADHVTINGGGIIDGQGQVWWDYVKGVKDAGVLGTDHPRPMGMLIDHAHHVTVEDITFQNAGFWQIVPYYSDYLTFRNLKVLAPQRGAPNTDGIDPFSSSHITIDHYWSSVGDDNIAIKSGAINSPGPDSPSTDILITDCHFEAGHGLSIGSEVAGGVQRVRAERIAFRGTDQGIRIKSNRDRGADISNLSFKDITMEGVGTSILVSEYYPRVMPEGEVAAAAVGRLTPHFHNIRIRNVKSVNGATAGVIVGLPESPVVNIKLTNVSIQAKKGLQIGYATVDLQHVQITAEQGKPLILGPRGKVTGKF